MNNRIEPGLAGLTPDIDQVTEHRQSPSQSNNTPPSSDSKEPQNNAKPQTSNGLVWLSLVLILGLAAGGYALYQQNLATQSQLIASNKRIAELEKALSATGEEMGESAGAIRARLTTLTERTDELWTQMDKLWGSAWRRNQSEIKKLQEQTNTLASNQTKAKSAADASVKSIKQSQTEQALKLSFLEEQLQATTTLKNQLSVINSSLDQVKSKSQDRDAKQLEIGASITQLEMTQNALTEQLERLKTQVSAKTRPQTN